MSEIKEKNTKRGRSAKISKEIFANLNRKSRQEKIEKIKEKALTTDDITNFLNKTDNFLGVFASDELCKLRIVSFPAFLVSNLDISSSPGSHWISLRVCEKSIEIFDSLGFDRKLWGKYPIGLQTFLARYKNSHSFLISPILQPIYTQDCGFYCIFFVLYRNLFTFAECVSYFSKILTLNHNILINKLKQY